MHDDDCCASGRTTETINADPTSPPSTGDTKIGATRSVLVKGAAWPVANESVAVRNVMSSIGRPLPANKQIDTTNSISTLVRFYKFGPFRLYTSERLLLNRKDPVILGGRAFDALIALIERRGEIVDTPELQKRIWPHVTVEPANVRVQMCILRKALGDGQNGDRYIVNVPGRGYCFVARVEYTR
jgi:DNA-binding winged helix-turn-helix (wHTH) protein